MANPLRILAVAAVPLVLTALACLGQEGGAKATSAADVSDDPVSSVLPERVATGAAARGEPSQGRSLSQPMPWGGERIVPFGQVLDRQAAKAESLADRATRRVFDGAPPVMPHSERFGEGSKTCLDCHTEGMTIGDRVAHPMSHAPYASCTQCHVESENRDLPPAAAVDTGFEGWRLKRAKIERPAGMPPAIPHDLRMRNRCLACHGEHGYPGMRTSHPERAVCVQCHVPETAER